MAHVRYFRIDSSCVSRSQTSRDCFEDYMAFIGARRGEQPVMVRIAKRPPWRNGGRVTDPTKATLRNEFVHFAGKRWVDLESWQSDGVQAQVETAPGESGAHSQCLRAIVVRDLDLANIRTPLRPKVCLNEVVPDRCAGRIDVDRIMRKDLRPTNGQGRRPMNIW